MNLRHTVSPIAILILSTALSAAAGQTKSPPPAAKPSAPAKQAAAPEGKTDATEEVIPPAAPDALFPAVVARVNGKAILGRDLEQRVRSQLAPIGNPEWAKLREDYRQQLIGQGMGALLAAELLYQKAKATGITATDAEVKAEFDRVQATFTSDAEMNTALAGRGMDRAGLNRELERQLVVSKFIDDTISKKITVAPAEVDEYYTKNPDDFKHPDVVRTSHILILVPAGATSEQDQAARQRMQGLLARIKKGEDFARLAKENSMDGSASQGGDIGFTPKGQLAPEYEAVAFSLPVGEVSDVVRTQFGYHIIKVTDRKKEGTSTLDEVRSGLEEFLKDRKAQSQVDELVQQLREKAKIELLIPLATAPQ